MKTVMKERLFLSLGQQLKHEIFFIKSVSRPYFNPQKDQQIIDFNYKSNKYKLVLNGSIYLITPAKEMEIKSYHDLVRGLLQSANNKN